MMKSPKQRDRPWRPTGHSEILWRPSASPPAISDTAPLWGGRRKGISDSEIRAFFVYLGQCKSDLQDRFILER
jgi:hypothetical protein